MSFNQIIYNNLKQNIAYYAIYLFALITSTTLFVSFVTLKYAHRLNANQTYPVIKEGSQIGSYFLFIIIIAFLLYANLLFIKRRSNEFALFQVLGLSRRNILYMIILEQFIIFCVTAVLGIIIGIFGSKILLMIVLKLLSAKLKVPIIFSIKAILETCVLLGISYILTVVQSYIFIRRHSIRQLSQGNYAKNERHLTKVTVSEITLGLLGIIMIIVGYYLSLNVIKYYEHIWIVFVILFCTIVGAYFFFKSTVSFIFKLVKRFRNGIISVNDVMFSASIMYRIKKNAFSLTVMAIVSAVTVSVLCFAAISRSMLASEVLYDSPHDVTLKNQQQANALANELNEKKIPHTYDYKEVLYTKLYKDRLFDIKTTEPDEITVTSDKYIPNTHLKRGQADLLVAEGSIQDLMSHKAHGTANIGTPTHHIHIKLRKDINKIYFMTDVDLGGPTFVLNDQDYQQLRKHTSMSNTVSQFGFDLKHKTDAIALEKAKNSVDPNIETRNEAASTMTSLTGILLFVTSFLGITFLIAVGCIIYIKQIDETEDELENYIILRKLGFTQKDMAKGLKLKILFNFGIPLIIALAHAYFASLAYMKLMGATNQLPIVTIMILYCCIYSIFAIAAYNHSSRTIRHSI